MRRRLSIRCAVLLAAFAVVASSGSALASPRGWAPSDQSLRRTPPPSSSLAGHKPTKESVGQRGSVDARALSRKARPSARPASLPNLGRGTAGKSTRPAAPRVGVGRPAPAGPGDPEHRGSRRPDGFRRARPHDRAVDQRRTARSVGGGRTRPRGPGRQPPDADHRSAGWRCDRRPAADFFLLPTSPTTFDSDRTRHLRQPARPLAGDRGELGLRYVRWRQFGNGYIDFAVSETADPTGDWEVHFLAFDGQAARLPGSRDVDRQGRRSPATSSR